MDIRVPFEPVTTAGTNLGRNAMNIADAYTLWFNDMNTLASTMWMDSAGVSAAEVSAAINALRSKATELEAALGGGVTQASSAAAEAVARGVARSQVV